MMSRKHYRAVAEILWTQRTEEMRKAEYVVDDIAARLVSYFRADNPRFDTERFMDAVRAGD